MSATGAQKVSLSFRDVRYSLRAGKGSKEILRGITGLVDPAEMLCILGPSGSGKTSLIQILGKKIKSDGSRDISGQVLCNGEELTSTEMMRISGFVSQEDVFNAELTVQECLRFAARLKLPRHQRLSRVDEVVSQLQLNDCLRTYIGDDSNPYLKGISGGEKRRLAIALEILDPSISVLVMDEPTSGLDAAAALNVSNVLRSLADSGITIAASLHQPRTSIMALFNRLMVIAEGRLAFSGSASECVPFLEGDLRCQVPQHESPYDLMLDLLNPAIEGKHINLEVGSAGEGSLADIFADAFDRSALRTKVDEATAAYTNGVDRTLLAMAGKGRSGWCGQFWTILHRTFLIKLRDPMVLATQVSTGFLMGVIFGGMYWQSYDKEDSNFAILDTQMCITMTIVMAMWMPFDVTLTFPTERRVFLRERKSGQYPTTAFYLARVLADMPMHVFAAVVMSSLVYAMAGLRMGFPQFAGINVMATLIGAAIMQCIGAMCRTFEEANLLMMPVMMVAMMTSTSFVRQVPSWLQWMRDISVMGLLADLAMYLEFRDARAEVGAGEEILSEYGVLTRSDGDALHAVFVLLVIMGIARTGTFLAVKFLHTGRSSCVENLAD